MTDETGARNSRTVVDVAHRRCCVRACVDACRQGNGSRVTAWRTQTQPSAASVSRSLLRAPSLSLFLSFFLPPIYSLSLVPGLVRLAHAPGATDSSGLGGHRAHAPVPMPSERLSLPLFLFLSFSSSRAEYIHIRTVHFSLHPVGFLGPHSLTFDLLRFRRLDRAHVQRIIASFSHRIAYARRAGDRRPRVSTGAIIDVSYREGLSYPPPTLAHFSRYSFSPFPSHHFPRPSLYHVVPPAHLLSSIASSPPANHPSRTTIYRRLFSPL